MSHSGQRGPLPVIGVRQSGGSRPSTWLPVAGAAMAAMASVALTMAIPPVAQRSTFLLPFFTVVAAAWWSGWRAAATVIVVASGLVGVFLLPPAASWRIGQAEDLVRLAAFILVAGIVTAFAAMTERTARRLRLVEELSGVVVESAPVLVAGADEDGRTVLFNEACEQVTGYRREEVLGRPFLDTFVPPAWRPRVAARFRDQPAERLAEPHQNPWITKTHEERLIEWRCFRVQSPGGGAMTLGIGQDVTDGARAARAAEEAIARERAALAAATAANQNTERFIATLSHELRTPLNAAWGWLQLVRKYPSGPQAQQGLTAIDRNLAMMAALVEDVVDYARVQAGKLSLQREPVVLRSFLESAVSSARGLAEARGIALRAELPQDLPVVHVDARRLQQIVMNLLNNALKFTGAGGEVLVAAERVNGEAVAVTVADTGIGILPEHLEFVFAPLWQGQTRSHAEQGLGLGLPLVKQLVEAHGGRITIASDGLGTGTRATIVLPPAAVAREEIAG